MQREDKKSLEYENFLHKQAFAQKDNPLPEIP